MAAGNRVSRHTHKEKTVSNIGDNSIGSEAAKALQSYVSRIEYLEQEKAERAEDIRDVYVEVKSKGFDTKIVRELIKRRKMDREARQEHDELLDLYEGIFE